MRITEKFLLEREKSMQAAGLNIHLQMSYGTVAVQHVNERGGYLTYDSGLTNKEAWAFMLGMWAGWEQCKLKPEVWTPRLVVAEDAHQPEEKERAEPMIGNTWRKCLKCGSKSVSLHAEVGEFLKAVCNSCGNEQE